MGKYFFVIGMFITVSFQVYAKGDVAGIEAVISQQAELFLKDERVTSVSIGVVSNNKSVTGHYGELIRDQGNRPTDQTIYEIGSVSKVVVGLLVAHAVAEGKLSLDTNVNEYIGNKLNKASSGASAVTVRQLLTHTSGFPKGYKDLGLTEENVNRENFIKKMNNFDVSPLKGEFHYSSAAIELLCYLLEQVYQQPFDTLLKQTLSQDADMSNTQVNLSYPQMPYFAYGYNDKNEIAKSHTTPNKLWGGSGYIKSTMADLLRFMKLQLQKEQPIVALSHQRLFDFVDGSGSFAFLWIVAEDEKLGTFLVHHGGLEGTQNWMFIFPEHDLGISIISNSSFRKMDRILRDVGWNIASLLVD